MKNLLTVKLCHPYTVVQMNVYRGYNGSRTEHSDWEVRSFMDVNFNAGASGNYSGYYVTQF